MFDAKYERSNFPRIRPEWLAQVAEPAVEPELPVVDPHHHLWDVESAFYHAAEFAADAGAGHRVLASVFVECKARFDAGAPAGFAPVGETRFAVTQANEAAQLPQGHANLVKGIVAYGDPFVANPQAVLEAHIEAGQGRMRGVRVRAAWHADPAFAAPHDGPDEHTIGAPELNRYCAILEEMGLVLDLWVYHTQLDQAAALARHHPNLPIVLNHCGGPLGIGPYANERAAVREAWGKSLARVASNDNVIVKIGGLAMPRTGLAFADAAKPASCLELVERWTPYVRTCIDLFGAERSMFESNFPVDKGSCNYVSVWNAFKIMSVGYPGTARHEMLAGTANRVYALGIEELTAEAIS